MKIVNVPIDSIRPSDWRACYVLKPDLKLLAKSMVEYGWLSPIVVRKSDSKIIDGFHRWVIAQSDKDFARKHDNTVVPVVFMDVDSIEAMVAHIRMNRSRGQLVAKNVSALVKNILRSKKYDEKEIRQLLTMTREEFDVLLDGTLLKHRNIANYEYSKAWVPVEVAATKSPDAIKIELPPNADR